MFYCDKCGLCCQRLNASDIYKDMHNGNGICYHYDADTKLCTVYEHRPIVCRVDDFYDRYLKNVISLDEYYRLNYESCLKLKGGV
jgi:hypothetical protein